MFVHATRSGTTADTSSVWMEYLASSMDAHDELRSPTDDDEIFIADRARA
jgi:hypothetical protein